MAARETYLGSRDSRSVEPILWSTAETFSTQTYYISYQARRFLLECREALSSSRYQCNCSDTSKYLYLCLKHFSSDQFFESQREPHRRAQTPRELYRPHRRALSGRRRGPGSPDEKTLPTRATTCCASTYSSCRPQSSCRPRARRKAAHNRAQMELLSTPDALIHMLSCK